MVRWISGDGDRSGSHGNKQPTDTAVGKYEDRSGSHGNKSPQERETVTVSDRSGLILRALKAHKGIFIGQIKRRAKNALLASNLRCLFLFGIRILLR